MGLNQIPLILLVCVGFPFCSALICTQCYSMTVKEHEKMETWFLEMIPNLHDPQCGEAYHSMASSTPAPKIISNQQPVLPTTCEISAVAGTNTEIRCGFYKGYIETRAHNGVGAATLNIFSMTCYNVDVNVDWGCSVREFPLPGDNLHFNNILQSKFSNLLTFDRFVGSVCYCRRTDCTDVINGSSTANPPIIATLLFSLFFILGRKFYF
ncbi:uncharacterized protein LOC111136705 [Crassostrea virginica]